MTNERAIKWLQMYLSRPIKWDNYSDETKTIRERAEKEIFEAFRMAFSALRKQIPIEPKIIEFEDTGVTWEKYEVSTCGVCDALLGDALFCPMCGKKVKWNETN